MIAKYQNMTDEIRYNWRKRGEHGWMVTRQREPLEKIFLC